MFIRLTKAIRVIGNKKSNEEFKEIFPQNKIAIYICEIFQ